VQKPIEQFTVAELKKAADELGLKNFQQMNKAALVELVKTALENGHDEKNQDQQEKPVENSGQKSQDNGLQQKDDLQSHPKFAKFKKGAN
jgi:hypothetical protein